LNQRLKWSLSGRIRRFLSDAHNSTTMVRNLK